MGIKPKYNPYQCNSCLDMDFSYFDDCVHRWCKAFDVALTEMVDLKESHWCKKYNHPKGSKKKAKYLDKAEYLMRYPE